MAFGPACNCAFVLVAAILLMAVPAWANAGTPLMWLTMGHLFLGNLLIGLLEGLILAKWLKLHPTRAIVVMILANYASCWAGFPIAAEISAHVPGWLGAPALRAMVWILIACFAVFIIVTILIEWPFVWFLIRKSPRAVSRSFPPCVGVQLISYAMLVPVYLMTGSVSLAMNAHIEPAPTFATPASAWVYFIDPDSGQLFRIRLDGSQRESVATTTYSDRDARLFANRNDFGSLDLCCVMPEKNTPPVVAIPAFARAAIPLRNERFSREPDTWSNVEFRNSWINPPPDQWYIRCGFWPGSGIMVANGSREAYSLSFEQPFSPGGWIFRNAAMYSKKQGVFQLDDEIVLIDAPTRRLAVLTRGRGPVVVLESIKENSTTRSTVQEAN